MWNLWMLNWRYIHWPLAVHTLTTGGTYGNQWALQGYRKSCGPKQAVCVPISSLLLHSALHFCYLEWVSCYQELVPVMHEHRCTATNNTWDRYRERDVTELLNCLQTVVTFVYNTMTHNKLLVNYYASLLVGHLQPSCAYSQSSYRAFGLVTPTCWILTVWLLPLNMSRAIGGHTQNCCEHPVVWGTVIMEHNFLLTKLLKEAYRKSRPAGMVWLH
jgi:hypothetical protein